ncbi:glycosyl hydrolase 2 galactose-binding domain-containing protein [Haloferula sargassicola]|uniref:Exo-beta-D-glucosaminidase n=1 Tax=Haloferula sargassicola TaxID=490096 RepID=A0ABP9UPD9_9BACT
MAAGRFLTHHHLLPIVAGTAWLLGIATAMAGDGRGEITLESTAGHGGSFDWKMERAGDTEGGRKVSMPGFSPAGWQPAIVPGTVLHSLVANGVYPDPYFGRNNDRGRNLIPDISDVGADHYTYWFRTPFSVPQSYAGRRVWLELEGVNYQADVWVNGRQVGQLAGMFQRGVYDITELVTPGSDQHALAVLVHPIDPPNGFSSPTHAGGNASNENANGADGKIGRYTTMLMTAGWDFTFDDGIRDRNTGIWRDVKLFATGPVTLRHPFVKSSLPLPSTSSASETISVEVTNATAERQAGTLSAHIAEGDIHLRQAVSLDPHETRTLTFRPGIFPDLVIRKPKLWWPFNKGDQPLYHLTVRFTQDGSVSDEVATRFGIRDIRTDRNTPDKSRVFYVNGKRLFLHGANWIPEAMCRTSDARTEAELRYTRQAGVNFLRFWGGGVTESDRFFELCDEMGILVWAEFWLTGNTELPADTELYRANVADTVKRIRNHPSLAYYVSANERTATTIVPIEDLLDELDGTRDYQAASEIDGIHDGSPYVSVNPMWYYEDTASPRGSRIHGLCPEYGAPILPTIDALREMMPESELWPIDTRTWDYLDGGGFHGMTKAYRNCTNQYGRSASIEEYAYKAQMYGGLVHKAIWECWNANRFEDGDRFSTGLLFWYLNSPNPQVCGRMWDWSLEPTAGLYFSQNAHEPVHAQYDFIKNTVSVNNELPHAFRGLSLDARILNFDMSEVYHKTTRFDLPPDRFLAGVQQVELPENLSPVHFIKLELRDRTGKMVSENFYWRSNQKYEPGRTWTGPLFAGFGDLSELPKVELETQLTQGEEKGRPFARIDVANPSKGLAFMVWVRLQDSRDGKPVRPAFYSDNFISLLPGEARSIRIDYPDGVDPRTTQVLVDGWNVARKLYRQGRVTDLPDIHDYTHAASRNLALNRPAKASSVKDHAAANAVDGDPSTRWSSEYADQQWIAVDLGSPKKVGSVELSWEAAYAPEYRIETSVNGKSWKIAAHVTDGDGGEDLVPFAPVSCRYLRVVGLQRATRYGLSLWDLAVYAPGEKAD